MKKGIFITTLLSGLIVMGALTACAETDSAFAGGDGSAEQPWQVATAEQMDLIRNDLTGHYELIEDIDLSGFENWEPIGAFQSLSDAPEDAEVPHPDYAFTGTFDGNGHTISNLTVVSENPMGAGLFGCASGTDEGAAYIRNFVLENVNVSGGYLVGGAVGLQFMKCSISDITLTGTNTLTGMQGIGDVVGTGFDLIENCTATADITVLGDDGACAGIIAGGTTMSSIKNCRTVDGSITAEGNATWGFGAVCGAPWGAPEITDCEAAGTKITVSGEGNRLVGGLVGFGGSYDETAPAQITGCKVEDVAIVVSDSTDSVGGLIGAGKEMMEGSDVMSSFEIRECSVSGSITGGGAHVDAVVGDPACAVYMAWAYKDVADGVKKEQLSFGEAYKRLLAFLLVEKAFDIVCLDQILCMSTDYYQRCYPETRGCSGWKNRSWNNKNQALRLVLYPVLCAAQEYILTRNKENG